MEDYNMSSIRQLQKQCLEMKLKALDMALASGSFGSHIGGAFSSMELLTSLFDIADIKGKDESRDRIIISKGHSVLSLYTVLWQKGLLSDDDLGSYDQNGTHLHGHPNRDLSRGIEFSAGSLGLGISYAVGVAIACKRKNLSNRVFCIVGDGECDEGIVWEAIQTATQLNLDNLTIIVDSNGYQLDGPTAEIMNQSKMADKLKAFGFDVVEVNGHDIEALLKVLPARADKPQAFIARTIKAHGISFLENNKMSHHCSLTKKKYQQAVEDIRKSYGLD